MRAWGQPTRVPPHPERAAARQALHGAATVAWRHALARVAPRRAVREHLHLDGDVLRVDGLAVPLPPGRLVALALGKASAAMVAGLSDVLGPRLHGGLAVVKERRPTDPAMPQGVRILEAGHPVPDGRSAAAGRELLAVAEGLGPGDLAIVLLSGGGSSLGATPLPGLEPEDLARVGEALLRSGAGVHEVNVVRRHLSRLHGGGLARALATTRSVTLALSDVPDDLSASIASGPTVSNPTRWEDVARVLDRRLGEDTVPRRVAALVREAIRGWVPETAPAATFDDARHVYRLVGSNEPARKEAARTLRGLGWPVDLVRETVADDVGETAAALLGRCRAGLDRAAAAAVVAGGEVTVDVTGPGLGGRNQHLAATAARLLDGLASAGRLDDTEIVVVSFGTDGTDGPTEAAGGRADAGTWSRARAAGLNPDDALDACDSHGLLQASGDLLLTGPTGTNVMDLYLALGVRRHSD